MRLSVVLATYNEQDNIAACLDTVKGWCDEIVVVDGGSKDLTVRLAKQYTARIIETDNPQIFHINKQKAIDAAGGDWILQLDADERVTSQLKTEIDSTIKKTEYNGFWIPRKNFFLGRFLMKGGIYPDYTLRLYRKGKGRLPQKDVHEQAVVLGKTAQLSSPLLHYADMTFSRFWIRHNRYTDLMARQLLDMGKSYSILRGIEYLLIKPIYWFFLAYFRHKGFLDSWQGFVFALFLGLRFPESYIKFIRNYARWTS